MSYLVLARRYRPQTFGSIVGQEHITRAIANAILRGRVPHAVLLTGPRGVGKTTTARVLARALNCTGRPLPPPGDVPPGVEPQTLVEPCGECTNCKEIARSANLAVREIDGASHNSVENVRDVIDSLRSLPPPGSAYKIYIIDEVHMLSTAAFNALLKSLEEPPPHTVFIFATTEPHKIPETVISRCQRHDFRRLPSTIIAECLRQIAADDGVEVEEDVFEFIALKAQGGMRDAQSMFDRLLAFSNDRITLSNASQLFGVVDRTYFFRLSAAVFQHDVRAALILLDEAFTQSIEVRSFVGDFLTHWRNILLASLAGAQPGDMPETSLARILEIPRSDRETMHGQLAAVEPFDVQRLFDIAQETADRALASAFPRFVLEAGVAKMASLADLRPLPDILKALENGGSGTGKSSPASAAPRASVRVELPREAQSTPRVEAAAESIRRAEAAEPAPAEQDAAPEATTLSWHEFVNFLKTERAEVLLATFLRRVSVRTFKKGLLVVEAGDFDAKQLRDPKTSQSLRAALEVFSGASQWSIRFEEPRAQGAVLAAGPAEQGGRTNGNGGAARTREAGPLPGSVDDLERQAERVRTQEIVTEARNSPVVKAALEVFEGSTVEKVSPLGRK